MELSVRTGPDRFAPPGAYRALESRLRAHAADLADVPAMVLSVFDRRTRMQPFVFMDARMFPCGARSVAASLHQAGFARTRAVFELWNPRVQPSRARIDGRRIELFLVSAMKIHAHRAYEAIRDAWRAADERPLIIAGGPKACYEPYDYWLAPGMHGAAPDVVVTGESYVLLDLLSVLVHYRGRGETMRRAFDRARRDGALTSVPGLVYLAPGASVAEPELVDTGLQRLVQHFDELPGELVGLGLLEPPHGGRELSAAPLGAADLRKHNMIVSLQVTQGCKFNCPYCPIPAANQKSWRFRSPGQVAHEIRTVYERFGIRHFFGSDDNFFNRRETAHEILSAMARTRAGGVPFGQRIAFMTEATEFDAYKNRDLLPLARAGGLRGLWFGIEDVTASLINKGQKPEKTTELFRAMIDADIRPHAMLMFHDGQPFYSRGSLYGLYNQIEFLRRAGVVSVQCTLHMPAVGTREFEQTYDSGRVIRSVGGHEIPESHFDGNHVVVTGQVAPWKRQLQLLAGYLAFYNPWNLLRALLIHDGRGVAKRRIEFHVVGMLASILTAIKVVPYAFQLFVRSVECHRAAPQNRPRVVHRPAAAFDRVPQAVLSMTGRQRRREELRAEPASVTD